MNRLIEPSRPLDYIRDLLTWADSHQIKAIATFVVAIIEKQTGNQAKLAPARGHQEAAIKQFCRSCLMIELDDEFIRLQTRM